SAPTDPVLPGPWRCPASWCGPTSPWAGQVGSIAGAASLSRGHGQFATPCGRHVAFGARVLPRALRLGGGEVRGAVPSTLAPPVDLDDAPPVDLDDGVLLSTLPARPRDRRLALAVILASAVAFCALVPFAQVALTPVWPFIPVYQSALVVNDLITAILLLGQVRIARSPALLTLASGYLFTAAMAVAHTLTFPGLFAPAGLLGAGPQTTAWLYMFWHAGFPLLVIAYALLKSRPGAARWRPRRIGLAVP